MRRGKNMTKTVKRYLFVVAAAAVLFLIIFVRNQSLRENGEFLSSVIEDDYDSIVVDINKINTKTDEVHEQKFLNKDEKERLGNFLSTQQFKKITGTKTSPSSDKGYLIEVRDQNGDIFFSLKSYGDEFITGFLTSNEIPMQNFKLRIRDKDWINHMECFFL